MNEIIRSLINVVGSDNVLWQDADLLVYEYDGSVDRGTPVFVVLPETTEEVSEIVRIARENSLPVVARGAGGQRHLRVGRILGRDPAPGRELSEDDRKELQSDSLPNGR